MENKNIIELPWIDFSTYDPKKAYCGVGKFKLPATHPFNKAGFIHDQRYDSWKAESTKIIDKEFHRTCLKIATELFYDCLISAERLESLAIEAGDYYRIIRIWGALRVIMAKIRGWEYLLRKK